MFQPSKLTAMLHAIPLMDTISGWMLDKIVARRSISLGKW